MTALTKYERLETTGLWRATPTEQRREVLLSFGKTSLVIRDHSTAPITHWSLSAIERMNPGERPALFEPGGGESLEVEDDTMIDAIEKIRKAVHRKKPHRGRLRLSVLMASVLGIGAVCVFWLPATLVSHALSVVPDSKRLDIGNRLLSEMTRLSGGICNAALGYAALEKLRDNLDPERVIGRVVILPTDARNLVLLPGHILTVGQSVVEDFDTPDVISGYLLSGIGLTETFDPMRPLLESAGTRTTFRLLTTGEINQAALRDYAESLLRQKDAFPTVDIVIPGFEDARVSSGPFAYARDFSGETVLGLIEADPFRSGTPEPLLTDGHWISLQAICEG